MKKTILLALVFLTFIACDGPQNSGSQIPEEEAMEEVIVGNDRDEHGCIGSAGESWSQLLERCIQVFNEALRLNPVESNANSIGAVFSAFVLFSDDQSKIEIFVPHTEERSYILESKEDHRYEGDDFAYSIEEGALYIKGEKKFEAAAEAFQLED